MNLLLLRYDLSELLKAEKELFVNTIFQCNFNVPQVGVVAFYDDDDEQGKYWTYTDCTGVQSICTCATKLADIILQSSQPRKSPKKSVKDMDTDKEGSDHEELSLEQIKKIDKREDRLKALVSLWLAQKKHLDNLVMFETMELKLLQDLGEPKTRFRTVDFPSLTAFTLQYKAAFGDSAMETMTQQYAGPSTRTIRQLWCETYCIQLYQQCLIPASSKSFKIEPGIYESLIRCAMEQCRRFPDQQLNIGYLCHDEIYIAGEILLKNDNTLTG
jgi:hypothetical protein